MNTEQAKQFKVPSGDYSGKRFAQLPLKYLKSLSKNSVKKDVREAATLVVNSRSHEIGEKELFQPTFKPVYVPRMVETVDYSNVIRGSLKDLIDQTPPGLF